MTVRRIGPRGPFFTFALAPLGMLMGFSACTHLKYGFAKNPLAPTSESFAQGKALYAQHCASCHGDSGLGDGTAGKDLPAVPTNLVVAQRDWSDGVFHIRMIARAKNGMPSFRETLSEEERWSVIHFVRSLDTQASVP